MRRPYKVYRSNPFRIPIVKPLMHSVEPLKDIAKENRISVQINILLRARGLRFADAAEVWRAYRTYWKIHWGAMLLLAWPIRRSIRAGRHVLVRVKPANPNLLANLKETVL